MSNVVIPSIFPATCHTNHVGPGSIFVAIKGCKQNGADYIPQALQHGAKTIVIQKNATITQKLQNLITRHNAKIIRVNNPRKKLALLSAKHSDHAHKKLKIIGITGTKGKTSTAFILEHILKSANYKTALISTVHNRILNQTFKSSLTTDQPDYLHAFFKTCVQKNVEFVVMEVAAQALSLHRVEGIAFDYVLFTNFAQEHGEFYANLQDYFAAKITLFEQLKPSGKSFANADDPSFKKILEKNPNVISFSIDKQRTFDCPTLFGKFNQYNIAAAVSVAQNIGLTKKTYIDSLKTFKGVPGRLELHQLANGAHVCIDYAHNPSSFEAVLSTLRPITHNLTVIFGAGGERDHKKRPAMGKIAAQIADKIIATSDNPRSEDPLRIIEDIAAGIAKQNLGKLKKEVDRKKAIQMACKNAQKNEIIAILGKGPDQYQIIGDKTMRFSEKEIISDF